MRFGNFIQLCGKTEHMSDTSYASIGIAHLEINQILPLASVVLQRQKNDFRNKQTKTVHGNSDKISTLFEPKLGFKLRSGCPL